MKLFFGTNSSTSKTNNIKLLYAAINSAIKNTDFEIFVLFDGKRNELELPNSVNVIEYRHRCYDFFKESNRCKNNIGVFDTATGAFLRTEIPNVVKMLGLNDSFCLYTDYDVIFQKGDYSVLDNIKPTNIAVSPEIDINCKNHFNSGVMVINIESMTKNDDLIIDNILNTFDQRNRGYDQPILNDIFKNKFDSLPLEFNWKPYWGINENAKIIHFHGAKPKLIEPEWRYDQPIVKLLRDKDEIAFEYYNKIFESYI